MITRYNIHYDNFPHEIYEEDGIVDSVYNLPELLVGKSIADAFEWCKSKGYVPVKYELKPISEEEQKLRALKIKREILHERWIQRKHWERFGDIEVSAYQ